MSRSNADDDPRFKKAVRKIVDNITISVPEAMKIANFTTDEINNLSLHQRIRRAAAKALWDFAHQGFSFSPSSWHALARAARRLDPLSRPRSPLFKKWPIRAMNPLVAEWLLFPARAMARRVGV